MSAAEERVEFEQTAEEHEQTFRRQLDEWGYSGDAEAEDISAPHLDAAADWQLQKYGEILARKAEVSDAAAARRSMVTDRVDAWEAEEHRKLDNALEWIEATLKTLFRGMKLVGKAKSRKLPHGSVGTKEVPERVEVTDKKKYLAWALAHADREKALVVKTTEVITKAPFDNLKAYYETTGWIPEEDECGWRVVDGRTDFVVKTPPI